jgi:hypothetical protein
MIQIFIQLEMQKIVLNALWCNSWVYLIDVRLESCGLFVFAIVLSAQKLGPEFISFSREQ